jgi:polyisoprenoid-binding protein YceI
MKRILPLIAAALLAAGCSNDYNPVAPTKPEPSPESLAGEALLSSGPKVVVTSENTKVTFVGTKPGGKHDGGFKKIDGTIGLTSMNPGGPVAGGAGKPARFTVEIDTDSLFADNPQLETHLKSPDFFNVKQYPTAKFVSTKVTPVEGKDDQYAVSGDLTLHGVTKSLTFTATSVSERGRFYLTASFKISQKDFGMTGGQGKVDDEVSVTVTVGKQQPAGKSAS